MLQAIMPLHMDSTMLTCSRSCMVKFRNEFIWGLRPPGLSIDLHAGSCIALGLEIFRRKFYGEHNTYEQAMRSAMAAFHVAWGDFEIPDYKKTAKTQDQCWLAVEEYFRRNPPRTDHMQPYYVNGEPTFEFTFAIPLEPCASSLFNEGGKWQYKNYDPDNYPNHFPLHPSGDPWLYAGRFDMLGTYMGKIPCVVDEKTTGRSISSGWADQWNLRNQFMGYVWACQQTGIPLENVLVRGICIQKTQIGFAEAFKTYPKFLIDRWREQLRRDMWRIRKAWDTGYFDYNFADACTSFGNCIFMNSCTSHDPEMWAADFEVRRWNPLLKNPAAAEEKAIEEDASVG